MGVRAPLRAVDRSGRAQLCASAYVHILPLRAADRSGRVVGELPPSEFFLHQNIPEALAIKILP